MRVHHNFIIVKIKNMKKKIPQSHKFRLWKLFDTDIDEPDLINNSDNEKEHNEVEKDNAHDKHQHSCYLCQTPLAIMEDGFPTCTNNNCGIIYKNVLDFSPEWRYFNAGDKNGSDPTRCGNPINPLLKESSFGCKIVCDYKSSYEMKRIRKWTEWQSTPYKERSLYDEFQFITIMAQNAGIPKIFIDHAMIIHKDISEQQMFRGMNRDGIKSASIYISCRLNGCPRTGQEISDIFNLDKSSATNGCSTALKILNNIERDMIPSQKTEFIITTPLLFIDRFCSKLEIKNELVLLAKFIIKKIEKMNLLSDNTPQSCAAGIVFFVVSMCHQNISKSDIKTVCSVSEVTINKCFKKLHFYLYFSRIHGGIRTSR